MQSFNGVLAQTARPAASRLVTWLWLAVLSCGLAGVAWLWWATSAPPTEPATPPTLVTEAILTPGSVARMDGLKTRFVLLEPGGSVVAEGADPAEPADPWQSPAGTLTFRFAGDDLWLLLAAGDYWGYLYVTVDGQPANRLPDIPSNENSLGRAAGYRTLYAPELQRADGPAPRWVQLHHAGDGGEHTAYVEIWRGWGQTPLRAAATTQTVSTQPPVWVGVALLMTAAWLLLAALAWRRQSGEQQSTTDRLRLGWLHRQSAALRPLALPVALLALLLIAAGLYATQWWLVTAGLGLLGLAALVRPAVWLAAFLFALPFYFQYSLPLLPGRSFSLIDIGLLGALLLVGVAWWAPDAAESGAELSPRAQQPARVKPALGRVDWLLPAALASWALIAVFAADQRGVALREWRVVFLAGALVAVVLPVLIRRQGPPHLATTLADDRWLLVVAWLVGGSVVAGAALWQYASGAGLITAEGVWRVRAFYGSPNNLGLYLERTLAVLLALVLFAQSWPGRLLWAGLAAVTGLALLLTFSKGALLLGLPALLAVLWLGGWVILGRQGRSRRLLWVVAGLAGFAALAMTPFLATERFQRLLDFSQGTGFVRLSLWRSSWQMALDHPLLGVGPDNFLYAYRSLYLLPAAWQEPNLNHPHNWPLDWWTRLGLPALALALFWFGWMIRRLWHGVKAGQQPVLSLGLLAAVVAGLTHGLIDASYALPDLMVVWVLIGFLVIETERRREIET